MKSGGQRFLKGKKKKKKNFPIAVRDLRSAVTGGAGLIIRAGEIVIVSVQLWGC